VAIWTSVRKSCVAVAVATVLALGFSSPSAGQRLHPRLPSASTLNVADALQIKVVGQPDYDTTTRVETDGFINFPYVGRVRAAGRSEESVAAEIAASLAEKKIVTDPHVLVERTSVGSTATVQGAVNQPGAVTLDRPTTLSQALSRVGGLKESAGRVILKRNGLAVQTYSARDIELGKVDTSRVPLGNDDEIYVDPHPFYYLYGFVNRTGQYLLNREMTVQQAIAAGGGIAPLGSDWRIQIKRRLANGTEMEISASLDDIVKPDDTVVVNERIF
jgi:polysaccharide export outer membrane protein